MCLRTNYNYRFGANRFPFEFCIDLLISHLVFTIIEVRRGNGITPVMILPIFRVLRHLMWSALQTGRVYR